jgi:hypothetical protein
VPIAERKVFGLMANHQIIAGFMVAEGSSSIERVVIVVLVVGGEVRLGNLVNQGLSSARQAAILASESSQPARGSAASDEIVQVPAGYTMRRTLILGFDLHLLLLTRSLQGQLGTMCIKTASCPRIEDIKITPQTLELETSYSLVS